MLFLKHKAGYKVHKGAIHADIDCNGCGGETIGGFINSGSVDARRFVRSFVRTADFAFLSEL